MGKQATSSKKVDVPAWELVLHVYPHRKTDLGPVNIKCFTGGFMNSVSVAFSLLVSSY